jgi:tellurite resistance protein
VVIGLMVAGTVRAIVRGKLLPAVNVTAPKDNVLSIERRAAAGSR